MIPEWLQWGIPFASGAAGVYAGLKVGIARLEANYVNLKILVNETKDTLKNQVGETRCKEYRTDCRETIHTRLDDIFKKLEKIDRDQVSIAIKVARIDNSAE